jgi:hypothetical protein
MIWLALQGNGADGEVLLTNERRYESKESREIEKCSMSPMLLRVSIEVREFAGRLGQRPFSSVGEG